MNSQTSSSALSPKVSNEAILPSLGAATMFWRPIKATAKTAAVLLSIWLFKLRLGSGWLFWDSFDDVGPPLLLDWYSISNWEYTGVSDHSFSSFLSCSLSCSISITSGISLIRELSDPKVSLL